MGKKGKRSAKRRRHRRKAGSRQGAARAHTALMKDVKVRLLALAEKLETEVLGVELFEHPYAEREDCAICFVPMPLDVSERVHLWTRCTMAGTKGVACGFCRADHDKRSATKSAFKDGTRVKHLEGRVESNDPIAMHVLAVFYEKGKYGLQVDEAHAAALYLQAAELGLLESIGTLANLCSNKKGPLANNESLGLKLATALAKKGGVYGYRLLGCHYMRNEDFAEAANHWCFGA